MMYNKLSDAVEVTGLNEYNGSRYAVYYGYPEFLRDAIFMEEEGINFPTTLEGLKDTHKYIGSIDAQGFEAVYMLMQGERWSPNGEAYDMIGDSGTAHTSMSVGDIVFDTKYFAAYICSPVGFKFLFTDVRGEVG